MSATTYVGTWTPERQPKRRPRSEVGIYLFTHAHSWRETGTHTWPSGKTDAVFTCRVCGNVIATSDIIESRTT